MTTLVPSSPKRSTLATVLLWALVVAACSSGPSADRPDASPGASGTPPSQTPSPTSRLPRNGDVVFSRAVVPSQDGLPVDAFLQLVDVGGSLGPVVAQRSAYRAAPSWGPDGRAFAYLGAHGISLWRDGGSKLLVPCHPQACSGLGAPAWSPTGSSIAFSGELDGEEGLFQVSPEGGEPTSIVTGSAVRGAPAWSTDGEELAAIVTEGPTSSLQVIDVASGQVERTIDLSGLEVGEAVSWSPDGAEMALEAASSGDGDGGSRGIYLIAPDGSDPLLLTECPDPGCVDLAPSFSPDGRWVVFTRARCDEPGSDCFVGDVWVIRTDGGGAHALTQGPGLDCCAAWRPRPPR